MYHLKVDLKVTVVKTINKYNLKNRFKMSVVKVQTIT